MNMIHVTKSLLVGIVVASVAVPVYQLTHSLTQEFCAGIATWIGIVLIFAFKELELTPVATTQTQVGRR